MPVGHVLVRDTGSDVKHDDAALALDVVSVAEATKLLLSSCIPDVEADGAIVGREGQRMDLHTKRSWPAQHQPAATNDKDASCISERGGKTYQCTSSRILPSSGAVGRTDIRPRSGSTAAQTSPTHLDESGFASASVTDYNHNSIAHREVSGAC